MTTPQKVTVSEMHAASIREVHTPQCKERTDSVRASCFALRVGSQLAEPRQGQSQARLGKAT
eukprot:136720-Pelagomonas_calceolata.AAC.3